MASSTVREATIRNPFLGDPAERLRKKPNGVNKARLKHLISAEKKSAALNEKSIPHEPNMINRFFALPAEVRNHIYRMLLVQPCKWDLQHKPQCRRFNSFYDHYPHGWLPGPAYSLYGQPDSSSNFACANCRPETWGSISHGHPVFVSPARSQWEPPRTNDLLCDSCYSIVVRLEVEAHPSMRWLRCLCARRQNLAILLVNKQFNQEAAYIFWAENCFAFEGAVELSSFLAGIRPVTRSLITQISVMMANKGDEYYLSHEILRPCWRLLRQCHGLTKLELDSVLLSELRWTLGLKNVTAKKEVVFSQRGPDFTSDCEYPCVPIYKGLSSRRPVGNSLTEALSYSMGRQRPLTHRATRELWNADRLEGE